MILIDIAFFFFASFGWMRALDLLVAPRMNLESAGDKKNALLSGGVALVAVFFL